MARSAAEKAVSLREHTKIANEISKDNKPTSDVVEHLQKQVANAFVLYANYKHYHWQTFGPLFRDLHLLFDCE
jgi:DNA-binding ferritin-like protein